MKKLILSMLAVSALIMSSCSSDDDDSSGGDGFVANPDDFKGKLTEGDKVTLDPTKEYNLTGALIVDAGATLTIPEGTKIKASGGTSSYIAVAQDGKIYINGTASNPVVMTSASSSPKAGDWGGLVICGKANTNKGGSEGQTATAEVSDLTYGGTDNDDNSGVVKYLRIEYTGANFNSEKEFNGLSLFGVGSGTIIEYVQSFEGGDDGIEFFGGSVNGKYLVSTNSGDDSIDFADGWSGTGENWYISGGSKAGIEGSNNGDNGKATPTTTATLKNITVVGPGSEGGIFIKEGGGKWKVDNFFISGYETGINIKGANDDPAANEFVANGDITFTNVTFEGVTTESNYEGTNEFYEIGESTGAGAGAEVPTWAKGWARFE